MSLLLFAMKQAQLKPQYHPSYKDKEDGPLSIQRKARKENLLRISAKLGKSPIRNIIKVIHETDPKIDLELARSLLQELCDEKKMDRQLSIYGGKTVYYTARPGFVD